MSDKMTIGVAVSATPKVELVEVDTKHQAMTVIHEDIRTTIGGSGVVDSDDLNVENWSSGTPTHVDSDDIGVSIASDGNTDVVCIKHTGFLADDTTVAVTDRAVPGNTQSLLILSSGGDILGELWPNEAMLFLRPQDNFKIKSGRTGEHVAAQVTLLGT